MYRALAPGPAVFMPMYMFGMKPSKSRRVCGLTCSICSAPKAVTESGTSCCDSWRRREVTTISSIRPDASCSAATPEGACTAKVKPKASGTKAPAKLSLPIAKLMIELALIWISPLQDDDARPLTKRAKLNFSLILVQAGNGVIAEFSGQCPTAP